MKGKSRIRNTLLALLLSLAMVVTYMPAWLITYAENDISDQPVSELNADVPDGDSAAEETGSKGDTGGTSETGEIANDSGNTGQTGDSSGESGGEAVTDPAVEQTDEQADGAKGPDGLEEGVEGDALLTEEGEGLDALDAELEAEEETRENNRTVLAFTSDIHNQSNNTAANRLESWLDVIQDKYDGEVDVMSFCGDMGDAHAGESDFWSYTTSVMNVVAGKSIPGVYTTGNHEFYNGKYSSTSNSVKGKYIVGEEGLNGSNFRIYCLGTDNWNNSQDNYTTGQISKLSSYLSSVGSDKPIIILTHFPLHRYNSRSTTNADKVIDVLNDAAASGKKIVLLWGHNHSVSDTFYDEIYEPGSEIPYNSSGSKKTFNFYYGAAGCMSDTEYGSGSAFVKGKGLVIAINAKKQLSFTYYTATGSTVSTYTEQDPVSAQGISVSPETLEIEQGRSGKISVTFTPSDTTNKGVTWTSSNEDVATVTNGKVKGVSVGNATITATSVDGGFTASCEVTVTERTSTDPEYIIKMGDYVLSNVHSDDVYNSGGSYGGSSSKYYGLEAVEYSQATKNDDSISWTITEADEGGGFYITDSDGNYLNATYTSSGSSWNSSSQGDLKVDGTKDIWVLDDGITLDNWEVDGSYLKSTNASDRYLAQVQGTGGTQMFTNRSKNSAAETTIEDTSALSDAVNATAIAVSPKTLSVEIGASKKLSVTYTPSTTTNKNVTWTSSDTSVATVSATGQVTGVAKGKATITATYSDGVLTDTAEVTVTKAAGSGVTPEVGKKYVILAGDGYALTSEGQEVGYSNGSDDQKYYYYGLTGEAYTVGQNVTPERLLWTFTAATRDGTQYYIQDQNGKYLNGSYEANDEGGYTGRLALSDEQDIWVITGATSGDTISGNILQSTNASANASSPKFLTHGNGDNGGDNTNIFTLRSEENATAAIFYEYDNSGTYVPDPDDPTPDDPTPTTGTTYKLVDSFTDGKDYLIVSANTAGSAYALTNPGGSSSGASMGRTAVTVQNGDVDGDGTADLYIETEAADIVWSAAANDEGFNLSNDGDTIEGKSGDVKIYSSVQYADRYWTYSGNQLQHVGGQNTYTVYYSSSFTSTYNSSSEKIYIYEKTEVAPGEDAVESVELDKATMTLTEGETGTLTATVKPTSAANKKVSWASSDDSVAAVDQTGKVTAVKAGNAIITVTTEDGGKTATCAVTVEAAPPAPEATKYVLTNTLEAGKKYVIASTNTAGSTYILGHDGEDAATYSSTVVNENGELTISESKGDVAFEAAAITNGFSLTNGGYYMTVEGSGDLTFSTTSSTKYWNYSEDNKLSSKSSSATRYLTFSNNEFKGYYSSSNPNPSDIFLYVEKIEGTDPVESVELDKTSMTLTEGETGALTATVKPATAANKNVTWASSDETVATVDQTGKVSAVKAGIADITVTTEEGGKTAVCAVTVEAAPPAPEATKYVLTDKLEAGKDYLIVNVAEVGSSSSRALKNPGGSSSGTKIDSNNGKTTVTVLEGNIIETADTDIVWTSVANEEDGVYLVNGEDYLEVYQRALYVFNPVKQPARYWTYADSQLSHIGGGSPYYLTYGNGSFSAGTAEGSMYLFVKKTDEGECEHEWGEWTVTTQPTCTAEGVETRTCSKCGKTETRPVAALGHNFGEWTVTTPATEEAEGVETRTCSRCGATETRPIPKLNHQHQLSPVQAKAATCTEAGNTAYWVCDQGDHACGLFFSDAEGTTEIQSGSWVIPATGHTWSEWAVTTEPTCTEAGVETRTCSKCDASETREVAALGHTPGEKVTENNVAPTCTTAGSYDEVVYCTVCHEELSRETVTVPALGHDLTPHEAHPATCTASGNSAFWSCATCGKFFSDADGTTEIQSGSWVIPATGHTPGEKVTENNVAPTCTAAGSYDEVVYCTACHAELSRDTVTVPATGHIWGEWTVTTQPTCTTAGVESRMCSKCGDTETRPVAALGHNLTPHESHAATCTEAGNSAYWSCEQCGKYFSDEEGTEEITSGSWVIPAKGHTPGEKVTENNVDPTCTDAGSYDEVVYCTECDAEISRNTVAVPALGHAWGEWSVTKPATEREEGVETRTCTRCSESETRSIPKLDHQHGLVHVDAKAATCTEAGNIEHWVCSNGDYPCGRLFADEAGTTELNTEDVVIPATGHDWNEPELAWAADNSSLTATFTCKNDSSHVETVNAEVTSATTDPTCETAGVTVYTARATFEGRSITYVKEVPISALGHDYELTEWTWAEDNSGASATFTCKNDETHVRTVQATVTSATTNATCETAGKTVYTALATFEGKDYTDSREIQIPATGHDYGLTEWTWAEDNSSATATFTCKNDSTHTVDVEADITTETTEATCDALGKTTFTAVAEFDGDHYPSIKEIIIPKKAHDWNDPVYEWADDDSTVTATRICKNFASHFETETATVEKATKDATCVDKGEITYTAIFKNSAFKTQTKSEEIPATGHTWSEWEETTAPTCTAAGVETRTCSKCGEKETRDGAAALGHDLKLTPAKAPTATAAGNTAYYTCSRCGKYFSDAAGTKEIAKNSWIIPATGEDKTPPAVTSLDTTIKGTTSCIVTWTGNRTAKNYRLAYKLTGGSYKYINVGSATRYTVTGLSAGKTYVFAVAAQDKSGRWSKYYYDSSWSYRFTGIVSPKATAKSGKVTIKWTKLASASGYQVRYGYAGGSRYTKSTTGGSKTISAGSKGKTVVYQVRPYKTVSGKKYLGAWSNQKSIRTR